MSFARCAAFLAMTISPVSIHAHDCRVGDVEVNPDNGNTYAGLTGIMVCRDEYGSCAFHEVGADYLSACPNPSY